MGNNAIAVNGAIVNGATAQVALTTHGSDFYFAVCAVMTVATIAFISLAFMRPRKDRVFHYITSGVTMVAAIAYFTMGSHLGWTPITVEFQRSNPIVRGTTREIYYARYIDWVITTPLLLLDLMLTAAMPLPSILWIILVDEVMIITGLIGALVASDYKWGYYVFGCVALFPILYVLVWEARKHANNISREAGQAFLYCGSLTALLWTFYPIAWGLSEGGNVISSDGEAVFYGVLDMLAKPGFGALLLWGHRHIPAESLGLNIHDYGENEPMVREKKGKHTNGTDNGVVNHDGVTGTNDTAAQTV
ncbi:family A G -coupled receptor [Lecanosticta acicola]|uniref:Family A G -coupled receptor n=1 Tax=Lecanosticta acicola TaxID=111012 RepID=A0AAI8YRG3_9PEZI|nr:family A G -coupled receptor [Lecanosticta acicola]